jgi:hypothetical protein
MVDAMQAIEMRLRLIAAGKGTPEEIFLMINEKIDALARARTILICGSNFRSDHWQLPEDCRAQCGTVVHIIRRIP